MKLSAHLNSITGALEENIIENMWEELPTLYRSLISLLFNVLVRGASCAGVPPTNV